MQFDRDVTGRKVVVLGSACGARRAVARFVRGGARVTLVSIDGPPATPAAWYDGLGEAAR